MDSGLIGRWSRSRNFYVSLREESWPVRLTSPKRPTSLEYRESRIYLGIKKKKGNGRIERFHGSKVRDITKSSNAVISIVAVCADSSLRRTDPAYNTTCENIFKVASRDCECGCDCECGY